MSAEVYQWIEIACESCHALRIVRVINVEYLSDTMTYEYGVDDLSPCTICFSDTCLWYINENT